MTLTSYVTHPELEAKDYVNGCWLEGKAYVNHTQLRQALPTPVVLPPRLEERMGLLERETLRPGGTVDKLGNALRDLTAKEHGTGVEAGPYNFRDSLAVEMWLKTLGVDDPLQFCPDWRMQLGMIRDAYGTEKEELQAMADAGKAGFTSLEIAKVNLSFKHPFPEAILRESK